MDVDRQRAQREATTNVARKGGQPETSSERTRDRALLRYLGAEFKRVTGRMSPTRKPPRSDE